MAVVFAMVGHLINLISGFKRAGPSDQKIPKRERTPAEYKFIGQRFVDSFFQ